MSHVRLVRGSNKALHAAKYHNQLPKGIIWSAVPLPCFFAVWKLQRVAGQWPQEATKSCRIGKNSICPSIRLSVHLFSHLSVHPSVHLRACQRALRASWRVLRANLRGLRGLRASWRDRNSQKSKSFIDFFLLKIFTLNPFFEPWVR